MFTHAMLLEGCHSTKCVCVCCEVSVLQIKRPSDGKKGEASDVTKGNRFEGFSPLFREEVRLFAPDL